MKYVILVTVLYYKAETKQISPDYFGFGKRTVACDSGQVKIKGRYLQTDSTIIVRKGNVLKTYYWYGLKK